jgi:hypothetical protein
VQRKQRIAARRQHQARPRLAAADQAVQAAEDARMSEQVRAVDDHDRRAGLGTVVSAQRGLEQAPEPPRLSVGRRQGEPRHLALPAGPRGTADPVGQQHGLAGPWPGGQQGKRQGRGPVEFGQQAGAGDMVRREPRHCQAQVRHCVRHG